MKPLACQARAAEPALRLALEPQLGLPAPPRPRCAAAASARAAPPRAPPAGPPRGRPSSPPGRPRGTATLASPMATASVAPTNRPVAQISSARATPTRATSGPVPPRSGTSPSEVSRIANCTSSATTRRSAARASWKPAPIAWPCTAATTTAGTARPGGEPALEVLDGLRGRLGAAGCHRDHVGLAGHAARREHRPVETGRERRALAPQHDDPDLGVEARRPPAPAPAHRLGVWALRRSGLSRLTVRTAPSRSTRRCGWGWAASVTRAGYPPVRGRGAATADVWARAPAHHRTPRRGRTAGPSGRAGRPRPP